MRAFLVLLLVAGTLVSGCSQKAATPDEETAPTSQFGCIEGVVVDTAIRPLGDAKVKVARINATVTTGPDGIFTFCDLDPGLYIVEASRIDYLPSSVNAEVRAGEKATPQIVLPADPAPKPFHRLMHFEGFINASAGAVNFLVDGVLRDYGVSTCACVFNFDAEGPIHTVIIEATWEDSVPRPAGRTQYRVEIEAMESGNMDRTYMRDPGYFWVDGAAFENDDRTFQVRLYPDETWPTVQQSYELFVTPFYYKGPPEGWSVIEGSS